MNSRVLWTRREKIEVFTAFNFDLKSEMPLTLHNPGDGLKVLKIQECTYGYAERARRAMRFLRHQKNKQMIAAKSKPAR